MEKTEITISISKEQIDEVFKHATHQQDYLVGLYKIVYPDWDEIKSVNGWPTVNMVTHKYIMGKAVEFDKVHHPEVFSGGLYMNNGFSSLRANEVEDWRVIPAEVEY